MAGHSSTFTVLFALAGNSLITIAKYIGWFFSGSGSMLSEAFHSTADVINQAFLLVGLKRSNRENDLLFHYGYGKANFFWSFISALGIFFFGAGLSIYHGIHGILHPDLESVSLFKKYLPLTLGILSVNMIVDLISLKIALKEINQSRPKDSSLWSYLQKSSNPTVIAIFLEDIAACIGVLFAFLGILLTIFFKNPLFDSIFSILIGGMMGWISIFLMIKNKHFLLGKAINPGTQEKILKALALHGSIDSIESAKSMVLSAHHYKLGIKVDFNGAYFLKQFSDIELQNYLERVDPKDLTKFKKVLEAFSEEIMVKLGLEIDRIESKMREQFPELREFDIEAT
jgi:zinc transporter 9